MPLHQLFFYLTIIFLPTQLARHFWPDWALVAGRRVDYLSPTFYLTDITIFATVLLWIFSPQKLRRFPVPILVCICLFVIGNIYSSLSPLVSFYKWLRVLEFAAFGWYIAKTKPSFHLLTLVLCIPIFYSSLLAIAQFLFQHSIGGVWWFLGERTFDSATPGIARVNWCWSIAACRELLRPYATFPHPNVLGGFLAVGLPMVFIIALSHDRMSRSKKIFLYITFLLGLIALILTFSRSAWIVGALGILFSLILKRKSTWVLLVAVCIGLACIPYIRTLTPASESVSVRQNLNRAAFALWKSYPLFGTGLGTFIMELPRISSSRDLFFLQPVHNVYLLLLSETGIIGFGFSMWGLYMILKKNFSIGLVVLLLLGYVDHYPLTLQQGQLLLTLLLALNFQSPR